MLSKFFTKDDPGPAMAGFSEDVKSLISSGEAKVGMTKWQMLYSKGAPLAAGNRKTFDMTLGEILNANKWVYLQGRIDKLYIEFSDDKVLSVKD